MVMLGQRRKIYGHTVGPVALTHNTEASKSDQANADKYSLEIINEGVHKRLKVYNVCCSQGGCK